MQAHDALGIQQCEHTANDDSKDAAASISKTNLLNGFRTE